MLHANANEGILSEEGTRHRYQPERHHPALRHHQGLARRHRHHQDLERYHLTITERWDSVDRDLEGITTGGNVTTMMSWNTAMKDWGFIFRTTPAILPRGAPAVTCQPHASFPS